MGTYEDLDQETRDMIEQAKRRMAATHSLEASGDPKELMKAHNKELHDAMLQMKSEMPKPKAEMKRQKIVQVSESLPTVDEIDAMREQSTTVPDVSTVQQTAVKPVKRGMVKQAIAEEPVAEEPEMKPEPVEEKVVEQPKMVSQFIPDQKYERGTPAVVYDSFTEITGLPSKGKFYPNKIYGQALKLIDMMLLANIDSDNVYDIFDEILARRVKGVSPENILSCDEVYILQWLRASSFPNQGIPHPGFTCTKCGLNMNLEDYQVTFKNMKFQIGENFDEVVEKHKNGYYAFHLDDGREINLYLRRRVHDSIVQTYKNGFVEKYGKEPPTGLMTIINTAAIVEIEGCEEMKDKVEYLSEMPYGSAKKMYDEIKNSVFTSEVLLEHRCPKCKGVVVTPYPFRLADYISNI